MKIIVNISNHYNKTHLHNTVYNLMIRWGHHFVMYVCSTTWDLETDNSYTCSSELVLIVNTHFCFANPKYLSSKSLLIKYNIDKWNKVASLL